jgi:sugar phosphate isomerase/epimerase
VAISTVVFDGHPLRWAAEMLADLGVAEVEPAYIDGYMPFDETTFTSANGQAIARLFADHGIAMRAVSAHTDLGRDDALDRLLRRLEFAAGAGLDTVISNATGAAGGAGLMRLIDTALPRLKAAGVVLALENPGHGQGALLPDGRSGAALVARWHSPWLRLNYDIGNAWSYSGGRIDLVADLDAALPFVRRLHLKDLAATGDDWAFCPLGAGDIGYGRVIPLDRIAGRDVTIEHPLRLWRPGRGDPLRRAAVPQEEAVRAAITAALRFLGHGPSGGRPWGVLPAL